MLYGGERVTKGTNADKGAESKGAGAESKDAESKGAGAGAEGAEKANAETADKGCNFFGFSGSVVPILFLEEDGFPGPVNGGRIVEGSLESSS